MPKIPLKNVPVNGDDDKKTFKITDVIVNRIKYFLIICVLLTTFYAFSNFNPNNYKDFFDSQAFIYVAVSYVFIYIGWQAISNKLPSFPIEIVKSSKKPQVDRQNLLILKTDRKILLFSVIGYTFSMAFSIMVMIFLAVALLSDTSQTLIIWNHFGEFMFETVLFIVAFIIAIVGFYFNFKLFRRVIKREVIQ